MGAVRRHAPGTVLADGLTVDYSWMGDGTTTVTASFKIGFKTLEFGSFNQGASVWVNQLETSFYRPGDRSTFGGPASRDEADIVGPGILPARQSRAGRSPVSQSKRGVPVGGTFSPGLLVRRWRAAT